MPEYITKEQAIDEVWDAFTSHDDPDLGRVIEENIERLPAADVIDRAELCAKLMSEFNVVDIDEDDGECTLNDQWVSIIDVIDIIDGMRAEGAESIWGNDARTGGEEE